MNRLWYTDGLSRKRYEERKKICRCFDMLESDFPAIMSRCVEMMRRVRFFNSSNEAEGVLYDLFRFQPLIVLSEIWQMDIDALEFKFRLQYECGGEESVSMLDRLVNKLEEWSKRLAYCRELRLTADLRTHPEVSKALKGKAVVKKEYYSLLEGVRKLQKNYRVYLQEIESSGKNDPALAVLKVFVQNYGEIAANFNDRWKEFPLFYLERVLHAAYRKPSSDSTWLVLKKGIGTGDVTVAKNTAFIAGKNADNTLFCYRSNEDISVVSLELERLCSYLLERDTGRFPAARLGYVTAILHREIHLHDRERPQELFGGKNSRLEPVGLLIESPMLLLREGCRNVFVTFRLTGESVVFFKALVEDVAAGQGGENHEVVYKLLNDAFYLEISTDEGWTVVPDYVLSYEAEDCLRLVFRLQEDFPSTALCYSGMHGMETGNPALRILMNRDAWLFPYSWAGQVEFDRVTLRTEVYGITGLQLYNAGGELDTSVPVFPFGVQPEKGAWFVFGNYEMASKSLKEVELISQWQQLPDHPEGFYGYYQGYRAGIDNLSFRVRLEWLAGKKWQAESGNPPCLFTPADGSLLLRNAPLPEYTRLSCRITGNFPPVATGEEAYIYGRSRSGFIKVVLEEPEIGFGHAAYRQLFTEVMIQNSRRKHPLPLPALPVSPMVDRWELNYVAEETVCLAVGQAESGTKLFHICPMTAGNLLPVAMDHPVALAEGPRDSGNLLLGFRGALGYEQVRLFVDVAPLRKEIDSRDSGEENSPGGGGRWYMNTGRGWEILPAGAVMRDSTDFFMNTGLIEILLPAPVAPGQLDEEGLFWLCAAFPAAYINRPPVRGIYLNAVQVISDTKGLEEHPEALAGLPAGTISASEENLPGIVEIEQIVNGRGGRPGGDAGELRLRLSDRIAHRNRALLPTDYERLVLQHFPQVVKVKCLPGLDTKGKGRPGVVTLVVVPRPEGEGWPLATHLLLTEIESCLQALTGEFTTVDAVNPVYEEMTVRCRVTLMPGVPLGEVTRRLEKRLNENIVPWKSTGGIPVFGYRFSLQALQNAVMEDEGVALLQGLSVLHITESGEREYRLDEYNIQESGEVMIRASQPWCVAVPAKRHFIELCGEWQERAGVGKLEIGKTLVVQ